MFIGFGRGALAGLLALITLLVTRQPLPDRRHWKSLAVIALCVAAGFPLLSAWAMTRLPASHGAILLGIAPLATAVVATFRSGERPSRRFWMASIAGSLVVLLHTLLNGVGDSGWGDLALLAGVALSAIGYAEGARLAREIGGWQVISWALVMAAPLLTIPVVRIAVEHGITAPASSWFGFLYVSIVSQFLAFMAWYHGMARGGVARVSQLQLLQPFMGLVAAALLLGETISPTMIVAALLVVGCVHVAKNAEVEEQSTAEHSEKRTPLRVRNEQVAGGFEVEVEC
jgi:drug/metabolite transporter (DMT)-like permease